MIKQQIAVDTLKDAIRSASSYQLDPFVFLKTWVYWTEYLHTKTLACKDGLYPTIADHKHEISDLIEVYDEELLGGEIGDVELFDLFHESLPIVYKQFIATYYSFDLPTPNLTYSELVAAWSDVVTYLNK